MEAYCEILCYFHKDGVLFNNKHEVWCLILRRKLFIIVEYADIYATYITALGDMDRKFNKYPYYCS
ncbi:hypothetical protein Hanom_Chr10g00966331 [Helianthus anomalus]